MFSILIRAILVNISTQMIFKFHHRSNFQLPTNTVEIDHYMDKICKVKTKQIGSVYKFNHFRWMVGIIMMA